MQDVVSPEGKTDYKEEFLIPIVECKQIDSLSCNDAVVRVMVKSRVNKEIVMSKLYYSMDSTLSEKYRDTVDLISSNDSVYRAKLLGLIPGEQYYCQAVVESTETTVTSSVFSFQTASGDPAVRVQLYVEENPYVWLRMDAASDVNIDSLGIVWGTDPYVCLNGHYETARTSTVFLQEYEQGQTYYIRSFGLVGDTVYYSELRSFETNYLTSAHVKTSPVCDVTDNYARTGYILMGKSSSRVLRMGLCWSTDFDPRVDSENCYYTNGTISDNLVQDTIRDLRPGTTYYVRAYVENESGISYGDKYKFTTKFPGATFHQPWKKIAFLPVDIRYSLTTVTCGERVFVFSWYDLWEYLPETRSWEKKQRMPEGKMPISIVVEGNNLYCVNACRGAVPLWKYCIDDDSWERLMDTLTTKGIALGLLHDKYIYYKEVGKTLLRYDIMNNICTSMNAMLFSSIADNSFVSYGFPVDDENLCFAYSGGSLGGTESFFYSLVDDSWLYKGFDFSGMYMLSTPFVLDIEDKFYLCGGFSAYRGMSTSDPLTFGFDPDSGKWKRLADCPNLGIIGLNVSANGCTVVKGGYVVCGNYLWQYYPEEDVDSELVAE